MLMLLLLALVELLVFGPIVGKVGFYLDDWRALELMQQAPRDLFSFCAYYFQHDPRIVNRPLEILHFGTMFFSFGTKPLLYHITNGFFEVVSAWFFYRCLSKLTGNSPLAGLAAVLLLVSPIHDCTHYWVVAGSVSLSLVMYFASLEMAIEYGSSQTSRRKIAFLIAGASLFGLSLFNYEVFLPLMAANVAAATFVTWRRTRQRRDALLAGGIVLATLVAAVAIYMAYLKVLAIMHPGAWLHAVSFSLPQIFTTVARGIALSLGIEPLQLGTQLVCGPGSALNPVTTGVAVVIGIACAVLTVAASRTKLDVTSSQVTSYLVIAAAGLAMTVASFTLFGLNSEYQPTLMTMVNRINAGGAVGASLVFASMLALLCSLKKKVWRVLAAGASALLAIAFVLTDVGMAQPWIASQQTQRHILSIAKADRAKILQSGTLMLADCPRYVYWAPVFDGTWDFQSAIRVSLKDENVDAGVVSDRLRADRGSVSDFSCDYLCGRFSTERMLLLDAGTSELVAISSTQSFIDAVRSHGLRFDLNSLAPARWQRELTASKRETSI